jgi:hypothetical protein
MHFRRPSQVADRAGSSSHRPGVDQQGLYSQIASALSFAARQTRARSAFFSLEIALHVFGFGTLTVDIHIFGNYTRIA